MGIAVRRPVSVKIIVTEEFRARRAVEIRTALAKLDVVAKKLAGRLKTGGDGVEDVLVERLRAEQKRNEAARLSLRHELEKLASLELGSEYNWGAVDGVFEVEVGDSFSKLGAHEIVVKDDTIIEIRDTLCPEPSEISS